MRSANLNTKTKNYTAIDIAKYAGALLVVAIHTFPFANISETFNLFFISTVCRLAVPFFFTASAFFFFSRTVWKKGGKIAENKDNRSLLLKYLKRLLILYGVWTVIYLPYTIWNYYAEGFTLSGLLGWLRDVLLNGSYYHLWFLPALILGMCIVYRLLEKTDLKKTLVISLVLYFIGYLINVFGPLWQQISGLSIVYGFIIKILGTARDGFFFAPVFLVIGAMLARFGRPKMKVCAIGFGISFLGLILEVSLYAWLGVLDTLSSMFLFLVPSIYFLMGMLLRLRLKEFPGAVMLRAESTLIYVSHILFARILFILLPDYNLTVYIATLACSQLFAYIIIKESRRFGWLKVLY